MGTKKKSVTATSSQLRKAKSRKFEISDHHPLDLSSEKATTIVLDAITADSAKEMVVLSADIRQSTFVMKEAVRFPTYAAIIGNFIEAAGLYIREHGGWFDKFTGDGYLAYWLVDEENLSPTLSQVLTVCHNTLMLFQDQVIPDLRANSKNFPRGVGLSFGLDGGPTHFATIAKELTIVGPTVVGAVRMVGVAKPWEVVANVYLGEVLYKNRGTLLEQHNIEVCKDYRETKEYPEQEVYPLLLKKTIGIAI